MNGVSPLDHFANDISACGIRQGGKLVEGGLNVSFAVTEMDADENGALRGRAWGIGVMVGA